MRDKCTCLCRMKIVNEIQICLCVCGVDEWKSDSLSLVKLHTHNCHIVTVNCLLYRINSTVHSVIVSCMCAYTMVYDDEITEDPIW